MPLFLAPSPRMRNMSFNYSFFRYKNSNSPARTSQANPFLKTKVFMGKKEAELIFIVGLFPDSPKGLPMDSIYKNELDSLRDLGRRIGDDMSF